MEPSDLLINIAAIFVALAGFSGIVATFQLREDRRITRGDALGLSIMVNFSLTGPVFCLSSIVLLSFGLDERTVWGVSSAAMSLNYFVWVVVMLWQIRSIRVSSFLVKALFTLFTFLALSGSTISAMNAAGIVFQQEFGPYLAMFVLPLAMVSIMFSRLLLRPMWRKLRVQRRVSPARRADPR